MKDAQNTAVEATPQPAPSQPEPEDTQLAALLKLASSTELFHTADQRAFAGVTVGKQRQHHAINSQFFSDWLVQRFTKLRGTPPQPNVLRTALDTLAGRARFDGPTEAVWMRVAERDREVYVDLANDDWQAVKITPTGWQIVNAPPVRFRRSKGMRPLPFPASNGDINDLRRFVNLDGEDAFVLFVGFLVGCLRPRGPYPALEVVGQQGTAKSTLCRVARRLIDPNAVPLRSKASTERDLVIAANHAWLPVFDNLSGIPDPMSDALCRLTSGGGFGTRTLYTDDEETTFDVTRPVIFNGIEELATRGDLLDRTVIVRAAVIPDEARREEDEFWAEFDQAAPSIVGALLNAVSTALRRWPSVKLKKKPRLADFARWVTAAEEAFGWPEHTFVKAYMRNRQEGSVRALEADETATLILELIREKDWRGTATELLDTLRSMSLGLSRTLPADATRMSGKLTRLAPNLLRNGVGIRSWTEGKESRKMIELSRADRSAGSAGSGGVTNAA